VWSNSPFLVVISVVIQSLADGMIFSEMQHWAQHHLTYPIFFLTYVSSSTIEFVKSFLEWMNDSIAKSFEHTRDNAFLLK